MNEVMPLERKHSMKSRGRIGCIWVSCQIVCFVRNLFCPAKSSGTGASSWIAVTQESPCMVHRILLSSVILCNLGRLNGRLEPKDRLLAILERVALDKTIILTQTSCGYIDFAENWIKHAEGIGIKNYLTVVDDEISFEYLNLRYPGHIVSVDVFSPGATNFDQPLLDYGSKPFNKMSCDRLTYQRKVLERGFTMLWIDMDTVLYQDPVAVMPGGLDFIGTDDILDEEGLNKSEQKTGNICGCLIFFRPTRNAKDFLRQWYDKCTTQELPDQTALNALWRESDWKQRLHWYIMPRQLFPSGRLEPKIDSVPEAKHRDKSRMLPVFIHANYRIGKNDKRSFLKERSAWMIPDRQAYPTCLRPSSQA